MEWWLIFTIRFSITVETHLLGEFPEGVSRKALPRREESSWLWGNSTPHRLGAPTECKGDSQEATSIHLCLLDYRHIENFWDSIIMPSPQPWTVYLQTLSPDKLSSCLDRYFVISVKRVAEIVGDQELITELGPGMFGSFEIFSEAISVKACWGDATERMEGQS